MIPSLVRVAPAGAPHTDVRLGTHTRWPHPGMGKVPARALKPPHRQPCPAAARPPAPRWGWDTGHPEGQRAAMDRAGQVGASPAQRHQHDPKVPCQRHPDQTWPGPKQVPPWNRGAGRGPYHIRLAGPSSRWGPRGEQFNGMLKPFVDNYTLWHTRASE